MNKHEERALKYFSDGYNCAQSVFAAFSEEMGMDEKTALRLSSAFGGGMGRLREVCGAVSGMFMVLSVLYGYDDAKDDDAKKLLYSRVQALAEEFKKDYGTIICRDLLQMHKDIAAPSGSGHAGACFAFVRSAAKITSEFIEKNPYSKV